MRTFFTADRHLFHNSVLKKHCKTTRYGEDVDEMHELMRTTPLSVAIRSSTSATWPKNIASSWLNATTRSETRSMKTRPFEFRRRRPVPGDVCLVIGFSFDVPGSISNLCRSVRVIKKVGGAVCMVRPTGERNLRGADERGTIHVPESWLLPLKPSSGSFAPVRPKPKIPSFA